MCPTERETVSVAGLSDQQDSERDRPGQKYLVLMYIFEVLVVIQLMGHVLIFVLILHVLLFLGVHYEYI